MTWIKALKWNLWCIWHRKKIKRIAKEMSYLPTPKGWIPSDWEQIGNLNHDEFCFIKLKEVK